METKIAIVIIFLVALLVLVCIAYSEEVSSNVLLRAQLKAHQDGKHKGYVVVGSSEEVDEIVHLKILLGCKDSEISRLSDVLLKHENPIYPKPAPCSDPDCSVCRSELNATSPGQKMAPTRTH